MSKKDDRIAELEALLDRATAEIGDYMTYTEWLEGNLMDTESALRSALALSAKFERALRIRQVADPLLAPQPSWTRTTPIPQIWCQSTTQPSPVEFWCNEERP
jgi:hypothetical protein